MPIEVAIEDNRGRHILGAVPPGGDCYMVNENSDDEILRIQLDVFDFVGRLTILEAEGFSPPTIKREISVRAITEEEPFLAEDFGYHGYIGRLSLILIHADLN